MGASGLLPQHNIKNQASGHVQHQTIPYFYGIFLLGTGILLFLSFLWIAIVSKILPPSGILLLDLIRDDWYYSVLVTLSVPVLMTSIYFHWLNMKLFKHA